MTLKEQLAKTQEEFDEKFESVILKGVQIPSQEYVDGVKQFIRQAQQDAVKAFSEEIRLSEYDTDTDMSDVHHRNIGYNLAVGDLNNKINNILKEV